MLLSIFEICLWASSGTYFRSSTYILSFPKLLLFFKKSPFHQGEWLVHFHQNRIILWRILLINSLVLLLIQLFSLVCLWWSVVSSVSLIWSFKWLECIYLSHLCISKFLLSHLQFIYLFLLWQCIYFFSKLRFFVGSAQFAFVYLLLTLFLLLLG